MITKQKQCGIFKTRNQYGLIEYKFSKALNDLFKFQFCSAIYSVFQGESVILRDNIPQVELHRYNQKKIPKYEVERLRR
jgi:hypothetical protein